MRLIGNPLYPENYIYQTEKTATYLGMFIKISLLFCLSIGSMYFGYTVIDEVSFSNVFTYTLIVPIIAFFSLYLTRKIDSLLPGLSLIFAITQGITIGYYVHLFYILNGSPTVLIAVFTTIVILVVMLFVNLIKPFRTQNVLFKGFIGSFLGIAFSLIGTLGLDYIGVSYDFDTLLVSIPIFSFFASLFYTIDFDQLFLLVDAEAPKKKEWELALGLILTIIWIYPRIILLIIYIFSNASKKQTK